MNIEFIECRYCKERVVPIKKKNKLKQNFIGQTFSGVDKRFLLVCPKCKKIIGSKNS